MIFKKDNFWFGLVMGMLAPILGLLLLKFYKFSVYSLRDTLRFVLFQEPGYRTLSAGLSVSLLLNALLFTLYINAHKDKTARGIFSFTLVYGLFILLVKTFY